MSWDKFITKNRPMIDEFLGPNNDQYTLIALKGKLSVEIGRDEAIKHFEHWMREKFTTKEQIKRIRDILGSFSILREYNEDDQK